MKSDPGKGIAILVAVLVIAVGGWLLYRASTQSDAVEPVDELLQRLKMATEEDRREVIEAVRIRGQADPETFVPKLIEILRTETAEPFVLRLIFTLDMTDADPSQPDPRRHAILVMQRRLRYQGPSAGTFRQLDDPGKIALRLPRPHLPGDGTPESARKLADQFVRTLIGRMTRPGALELLLEVTRPGADTAKPSLWTGDAASFDAYIKAEQKRMDAALESGARYVPSRSDYVLSLLRPETPGGEPGLALLRRSPDSSKRFDRSALALDAGIRKEAGDVVLEIRATDERLADLQAWSREHIGRRVALVVDGRSELLVPLQSELGAKTLIPLGPASDPAVMVWARGIVNAVVPGALPLPMTGAEDRSIPLDVATPTMEALVAIGVPAGEALAALQAEGGEVGIRARRILEQIGRRNVRPQ